MPARTAPSDLPDPADRKYAVRRNVISPVMAMSWRAERPDSVDTIAEAIVTPAEGPSFGIAPAGTCTCTSRSNISSGIWSACACDRAYVHAARADSFITSPSWPVNTSSPLPSHRGSLDEHDIAAGRGVIHAGGDADFVFPRRFLRVHPRTS